MTTYHMQLLAIRRIRFKNEISTNIYEKEILLKQ